MIVKSMVNLLRSVSAIISSVANKDFWHGVTRIVALIVAIDDMVFKKHVILLTFHHKNRSFSRITIM